MGFGDWIKGLFGKKDTAQTNEPRGETSGDITGTAADTEVAGSVGETSPADVERPSDPDAP